MENKEPQDIAAEFMLSILDSAKIEGDIEVETKDNYIYLTIDSQDKNTNLKTFANKKAIDILSYLTRTVVNKNTKYEDSKKIIIDVLGSREKRLHELEAIVDQAFVELNTTGITKKALPYMNSYERKIVHDKASEKNLKSVSEGFGKNRHILLSKND